MKKTLRLLSGLILNLIVASLVACTSEKDNGVSEFYDLGEEGMIPQKEYVFNPLDSIFGLQAGDLSDIELAVRFSDQFSLQSLPLTIEFGDLKNESIFRKEIDLLLYGNDDRHLGKGTLGIYESEFPLGSFHLEEGFFISVSTPELSTRGIHAIGLLYKPVQKY